MILPLVVSCAPWFSRYVNVKLHAISFLWYPNGKFRGKLRANCGTEALCLFHNLFLDTEQHVLE